MVLTFFWIIFCLTPVASRTREMFSYTVLLGISLKSWKMIPNFLLRAGIFFLGILDRLTPFIRICPSDAFSPRYSILMSVVFPAPEGPLINIKSFFFMSREIVFRAYCAPYRLLTRNILIAWLLLDVSFIDVIWFMFPSPSGLTFKNNAGISVYLLSRSAVSSFPYTKPPLDPITASSFSGGL